MSTLNQEISRLESAKSAINEMLISKGVSIPENATLDTYADLIDSIKTGKNFNKIGEITLNDSGNYRDYNEIPIVLTNEKAIYLKIVNAELNLDAENIGEYRDGFIDYGYCFDYEHFTIIENATGDSYIPIGFSIYTCFTSLGNGNNYKAYLYCNIYPDGTIQLMNPSPAILTVEYGYFEGADTVQENTAQEIHFVIVNENDIDIYCLAREGMNWGEWFFSDYYQLISNGLNLSLATNALGTLKIDGLYSEYGGDLYAMQPIEDNGVFYTYY